MIIIDHRLPHKAKQNLKKIGNVVELKTVGLTYDAISGHPDIFFCQIDKSLIVAPNLPEYITNLLTSNGVSFQWGERGVGDKYPNTAHYNAVSTRNYIIHNFKITDPEILKQTASKKRINIKQGYGRCNLLALGENHFITSDLGIYSTLKKNGISSLYINPKKILLPGFSYGFFGGTCGVYLNTVYVIGKLNYLEQEKAVRDFIHSAGYEVVELYDGPLFDGGSILFLEP